MSKTTKIVTSRVVTGTGLNFGSPWLIGTKLDNVKALKGGAK